MKKLILSILLCMTMVIAPTQKSHAIVWVIVKAAIKKVIKAIDLQVQRQQNKVIWAQNLQKQLENVLSKYKLNEISEWNEKQKQQYQKYYDELQQVKSVITYCHRVKEIISKQALMLQEYQRAWNLIRNDTHFSAKQLEHMAQVYAGILRESLKNLDQVAIVISPFKMQMSDQKRMEIINEAAERIDSNYSDLRQYTSENAMLSLQQAKDQSDALFIKKMYGINQ